MLFHQNIYIMALYSLSYDLRNQRDYQTLYDELKKFKELLDMGVISQEEFDAKKKQLLGL